MDKIKIIAIVGVILILIISIFSVINIYSISQSISQLRTDIKFKKDVLGDAESQLSTAQNELSIAYNELNEIKEELQEKNSEISLLQSGENYELHDPTYSELMTFLYKDKTNKEEYVEDMFACGDFAREVNNNAEEQGIRCAFVVVHLRGMDHACVAFNTTEAGIRFFEPQSDQRVDLSKVDCSLPLHYNYWSDLVIIQSGYYYPRDPDWDIESYELYW